MAGSSSSSASNTWREDTWPASRVMYSGRVSRGSSALRTRAGSDRSHSRRSVRSRCTPHAPTVSPSRAPASFATAPATAPAAAAVHAPAAAAAASSAAAAAAAAAFSATCAFRPATSTPMVRVRASSSRAVRAASRSPSDSVRYIAGPSSIVSVGVAGLGRGGSSYNRRRWCAPQSTVVVHLLLVVQGVVPLRRGGLAAE